MRIVDKTSSIPLHCQISELLREMIENEELLPGELIPPERQLCDLQGVSRMTVNKAILSLVNEGLLYREQGKGTFVSKPKSKRNLSQLKGFSEVMSSAGLHTETTVLSFKIKSSTKAISKILNINSFDKIIEIMRLRNSESEPVALETVILPLKYFPNMTQETIDNRSLYEIFKDTYGINVNSAKETIEPIVLNEYEANLLDQNEGSLALLFKRITSDKDGNTIEYTKSIYRSDKYKYEIVLT